MILFVVIKYGVNILFVVLSEYERVGFSFNRGYIELLYGYCIYI